MKGGFSSQEKWMSWALYLNPVRRSASVWGNWQPILFCGGLMLLLLLIQLYFWHLSMCTFVESTAYNKLVCFCLHLTYCTLRYTMLYSKMPTVSIKVRQREHNNWVISARPLHESTFIIFIVSSEERSNNRAVWLLLLAITLKATTKSLTCWLWERASILWHQWQKYSIRLYLYVS